MADKTTVKTAAPAPKPAPAAKPKNQHPRIGEIQAAEEKALAAIVTGGQPARVAHFRALAALAAASK
jgi:hypothetical protein